MVEPFPPPNSVCFSLTSSSTAEHTNLLKFLRLGKPVNRNFDLLDVGLIRGEASLEVLAEKRQWLSCKCDVRAPLMLAISSLAFWIKINGGFQPYAEKSGLCNFNLLDLTWGWWYFGVVKSFQGWRRNLAENYVSNLEYAVGSEPILNFGP